MSDWNENLDEAPYETSLEVVNNQMDEPVFATRGFVCDNGCVHADQHFFTQNGSGNLVCPAKWRLHK